MTRTAGIIGVSVVMLAAACSSPPRDDAAPAAAPLAVTVSQATMATVAERLEAGGVVAASESADVSSRILAPILTVNVRAGDRVRAGDVVATLDARDIAAQGRQTRAAVAAAEQALVQARSEQDAAAAEQKLATAWHTRIASLRERNSATAQELDEAEARLAAATAHMAGAQARIDQATAAIAASRAAADAAAAVETYAAIRAPFDGVVTERLIDPGNLATPGSPLLRIDAGGARRVEARVDEARAAYVKPGDRVDVRLNAEGEEGDEIEGTVIEVARAIAADQRAFTVKVALPAVETARTGTFARVRFRGAARKALVVPAKAIQRHGQVTSLFVVRDGIARLRLVQSGVTTPEGTEILAGLDDGETVITSPPPALEDGRRVTVAAGQARSEARP